MRYAYTINSCTINSCTIHHTPRTIHHTPYTIHHACTTHHEPYTTHRAPHTAHHTPSHHTPSHHIPYLPARAAECEEERIMWSLSNSLWRLKVPLTQSASGCRPVPTSGSMYVISVSTDNESSQVYVVVNEERWASHSAHVPLFFAESTLVAARLSVTASAISADASHK
jgi:hypothetical protein